MKSMLAALSLVAFGTVAHACPNFSGNYILNTDEGQIHINMQQQACDSIALTIDFAGENTQQATIVTDGVQHSSQNENGVVTTFTNTWSGDKLIGVSDDVDAQGNPEHIVSNMNLDAQGNLVNDTYITMGDTTARETQTYTKVVN